MSYLHGETLPEHMQPGGAPSPPAPASLGHCCTVFPRRPRLREAEGLTKAALPVRGGPGSRRVLMWRR